MPYAMYTELEKPKRSGYTFTANWKLVGGDQYTWTDCVWDVNGEQTFSDHGQSGSTTSSTYNTLDITQFYPYPGKGKRLSTIQYRVRGGDFIDGRFPDFVLSPVLNIYAPKTPEVTLTKGSNASEVTVTVKANSIESDVYGEYPRIQMNVQVTVRDRYGVWRTLFDGTTTDSQWSQSFNVSTYEHQLGDGEHILVYCSAWSQGPGGSSDSAHGMVYYAKPNIPVIRSIDIPNADPTTGRAVINVSTNTAAAYIDSVKLERLQSSNATTPAEAAVITSGWTPVTTDEDGDTYGFTDMLAYAYPADGTRTWYRVTSIHDSYSVPSVPAMLPIFNPLPVAGKAHIYSAISGDDGTSAKIGVAWKAESNSGTTAQATFHTQVAWSKNQYALQSTEQPTQSDFDWQDSTAQWTSTTPPFDTTGTVYISGLEEGKTYYVWARRVMVLNNETTYGDWSEMATVIPTSAPAWVELASPNVIARGEQLPLTWTFGSEATQTGWHLTDSDGKVWASGTDADGATTIPADKLVGVDSLTLTVSVTTGGGWVTSTPKVTLIAERPTCEVSMGSDTVTEQPVIASIECDTAGVETTAYIVANGITYAMPDGSRTQFAGDIIWASTLSPEWSEATEGYEAELMLPSGIDIVDGGTYELMVSVTDRSTGLSSDVSSVQFSVNWGHKASAPTATITPDKSTLSCDVLVTAPSVYGRYGFTLDTTPVDGRTYYSKNGTTYTEVVSVPDDYELTEDTVIDEDKTYYTRSGTEGAYEYTEVSEPDVEDIATYYEKFPGNPSELGYYELMPDVCDLYRVTPDGADLIASDVEFGSTVKDLLAPFTSAQSGVATSYIVATRTVDGAVAWREVEYTLHAGGLVLDWPGNRLALPFNVENDESFDKDFESRTHMDGKTEGYWEDGSTRNASISTDLIRLDSSDERELVRSVARYCGAVFVRAGNGIAFDADVQITKLSESYSSGAIAVSLSCSGIELTDAHRCQLPDITAPESGVNP